MKTRFGKYIKYILGILIIAVTISITTFVLANTIFAVKLVEVVSVEAGSEIPIISEFFSEETPSATFVTDMKAIPMNEPGVHEIKLLVRKKEYFSKLEIKDTKAPDAEVVGFEIWPEEVKQPEEFLKNIVDVTDVKVYFQKNPDYSITGIQEVSVVLEDTSGNKTVKTATLTIKTDTEPPVIKGVKDQSLFVGDKISYKKDIVVTDGRDQQVELKIDSSSVNLKKAGSYKVTYIAVDDAGNSVSAAATIHVKEKPVPKPIVQSTLLAPTGQNNNQVEVNKLADQVLAKITKSGMTDIQKAWAIYSFVKKNITYTGSSDKSDWITGALRGLKQGTGDCFNYYATSRILLTRAGIQNQTVTRVGGESRHYWNLVLVGGGWFHFDTTPNWKPYLVCFLRTDKEIADYTSKVKNYYTFDKTKYPATPLTPLPQRNAYIK